MPPLMAMEPKRCTKRVAGDRMIMRQRFINCITKAIRFNTDQLDEVMDLVENISRRASDASDAVCRHNENAKVVETAWRCKQMMGMFDAATEAACLDKVAPMYMRRYADIIMTTMTMENKAHIMCSAGYRIQQLVSRRCRDCVRSYILMEYFVGVYLRTGLK